MGFDALICEKNDSSKLKKALNKMHMGKFSYLAISLQTIFLMKPFGATVHFEDAGTPENSTLRLDHMIFLAAMNFRAEGGGIKMSPMAVPDDGYFTICAVSNVKKLLLLQKFLLLATSLHVKNKSFTFKLGSLDHILREVCCAKSVINELIKLLCAIEICYLGVIGHIAFSPTENTGNCAVSKQFFCAVYQFLHLISPNLTFFPREWIFETNSFIVVENLTPSAAETHSTLVRPFSIPIYSSMENSIAILLLA